MSGYNGNVHVDGWDEKPSKAGALKKAFSSPCLKLQKQLDLKMF